MHEKQRPRHKSKSKSNPTRHHNHHPGSFKKLKATVDKNRKGFAFLIFPSKDMDDIFVPPREATKLFHGDLVEVTLGSNKEVINLKVVRHRFSSLVGRFTPIPSRSGLRRGWVVYERKQSREEVYVQNAPPKVRAGDWVRVKLFFHEGGPFPVTAEILESFGQTIPSTADLPMVAAEFGLIEEHAKTAERESAQLEKMAGSSAVIEKLMRGRRDLQGLPFITIDGENARDFDDAVTVERTNSGYVLWVAIADVSYYVTPGSALDKEAYSRGTSVYFPERAFHMLPRALSENLCSLRPNELRPVMVAKMTYNRNGHKTAVDVMEAVIKSRRRATYNELESEWLKNKNNKNNNDNNWEYSAHFELFDIIKKQRSKRGSIDFDLPEIEVRTDSSGEPQSIHRRERLESHRLIEEFMIAANESVTEWIIKRGKPFIYRIHDEPSDQALLKFQKLAATVGLAVSLSEENLSQTMSDLVRRLDGHPAQDMLNMGLLRSMKQAVYSSVNVGHFGLASKAYTHFTSPIRRYPDLIVHRILRQALAEGAGKSQAKHPDVKHQKTELDQVAEHCSYRERLAADAERESVRIKQVRAMLPRLGDEFDAKVIGMIDSGLFVQINDPYVEGLISRDSMTDDLYEFNEERMIFYGKRKKRTFRIGDSLRVVVVRADLERRQIDFGLVRQN